MSICDDATVALVLSDYANQDTAQKINILGAGWNITGLGPNGLAPEQTVVVFLEVPPQYRGERFATCLTLLGEGGDPVAFPGPDGQPQPLRAQQLVQVDPPLAPGVHIPPHVPSRMQIVMRLANGLPLTPNQLYTWAFEIDGNRKASLSFYVSGPPPAPVVG